jgi:hypothetical protein
MTAVHPTAFKQQVAKKKKLICETEVHPLRYAGGRTNYCNHCFDIERWLQAFF